MKITHTVITTALFALSSISATAQGVDKLIDIMDIENQMIGGFEAMLPVVNQLSAQLSLDEQERNELLDIYRDWFENDIDRAKLTEEISKLYSQTFSAAEIQELIIFYSSPVGKKLVRETPALSQKSAELGMTEAQSKQPQLLEKLNPFIEEHSPQGSAFAQVRRTAQEKTIRNNLRMLASAADQYFLEHGTTDVEMDQLIGPDKYIRQLEPVDGEDYSNLNLSLEAQQWKVTSKSGITVTLER